MQDVVQHLNEIREIYRKAGVADDFLMVEDLALMLLKQARPDASVPSLPVRRVPLPPDGEAVAQRLLSQAVQMSGLPHRDFLNRCLVLLLVEREGGDLYPTPRHLIDAIVETLQPSPSDRALDPACGSAGFLAGLPCNDAVGIELAPKWSRLAAVNLLLHGKSYRVHTGDALRPSTQADRYDIIVTNPPLGGEGKEQRLDQQFLKTALGLLNPRGRLAMLVTNQLLESPRDEEVRRRLFAQGRVTAVAQLPQHVLSPFRRQSANLLLFQNGTSYRPFTWFLRLEGDGYSKNADRFAEPNEDTNDLLLLKPLVSPRFDEEIILPYLIPVAHVRTLQAASDRLIGYEVCPADHLRAATVQIYRFQDGELRPLVGLATKQGKVTQWVGMGKAGQTLTGNNPQQVLHQLSGYSGARQQAEYDLASTFLGMPIALSARGSLFAVAVPPAEVTGNQQYSLDPARYVDTKDPGDRLRSPDELIREIRANQTQMDAVLGQLLRPTAFIAPKAGTDWPPELPQNRRGAGLAPFGISSAEQLQVWSMIERWVDPVAHCPAHFDVLNVKPGAQDERQVRNTLELFLRMGVIVRVFVDGRPLYRRSLAADLVEQSSG